MDLDLIIRNGTVIDGTGRPRFRADLGVRDGRIAAVSEGEPLQGRHSVDAAGLIVAPGFLDIHSHADWILPLEDHDDILAPLLLQGVTTIVGGNCGFSPAPVTEASIPLEDGYSEMCRERAFEYQWRSFGEFLGEMERRGMLLNCGFLVGHGALRYAAMGASTTAADAAQRQAMRDGTRRALEVGALGFSTGLAYAPCIFASNEELLAMLRVVAETGAVFTVHGRAYSWVSALYTPMIGGTAHNIRSVRELLDLGRQAAVRTQLSHQIFVGRRTWRTHRSVLRDIERAAASGLDVAFDAFPYTCGNTTINVIFPAWFLADFHRLVDDSQALKRLKREIDLLRLALGIGYGDLVLLHVGRPELAELEGLDFAEIARRLKKTPFDAYMHVARASGGKARILLYTYSGDETNEAPLRAALSHPLCSFMTDTILTRRGKANPASYGTFPRILGRYSRDLGLFPLEEAVRRMTSYPAERMGLAGVGRIAEGGPADLVLFDAASVADRTTREQPDLPPVGIHAVLLAGQIVVQEGRLIPGPRRGRVLRR
ncbi:MAG TPA: amidohydrolase family protein [Anaerolineae bacterium]|nr:amidohydrolase family protein [Anaerolineae bacterium]